LWITLGQFIKSIRLQVLLHQPAELFGRLGIGDLPSGARARDSELAVQDGSCFLKFLSEVQHLLQLQTGVGHSTTVDVLKEDEDDRRLVFLPAFEGAVKFFFSVRRKMFRIWGVLPPATVHDQYEDIATVDLFVSLITLWVRGPVEASVSSQPRAVNSTFAPTPKPSLSSSMHSRNARRSTAKSLGDAMKTLICRLSLIQ
jgi:hypothetical protein